MSASKHIRHIFAKTYSYSRHLRQPVNVIMSNSLTLKNPTFTPTMMARHATSYADYYIVSWLTIAGVRQAEDTLTGTKYDVGYFGLHSTDISELGELI